MNAPLLEAVNLTALRGHHPIFRCLNLQLHRGQALHLGGENGSGKTTLLQALAGILPETGGRIIRRCPLLYLGHQPGIKPLLTVAENLELAARLYHGLDAAAAARAVPAALAQTGIAHLAKRQARFLSAGQTRRIQLARLWLPTPPLWLLDEPLTALDVQTVAALGERCREHIAADGALLLTSHQPFPLDTLRFIDLQALCRTADSAAEDDEETF